MNVNITELQDDNITNQVNQMVEQVNTALAESAKSLTCGPDCQAQENIQSLRQIYLDAELNLQSAPDKLNVAEKNYLLSVLGQGDYDDYIKTRLTTQSNTMGEKITASFVSTLTECVKLNDIYETVYTNYDYLNDLYENYSSTNTDLKNDINKATGDVVTSDRKTYYESQNYSYLKNWYTVYKFIYIIIIIIFIIFLFVRRSEYSFISRFFILVLFILYPIYITRFVFWIWNKVILRIWELLPSNIYKSI